MATLSALAFGVACRDHDADPRAAAPAAHDPSAVVSIEVKLNGIPRTSSLPIVVPPSGFVIDATWPRLEGARARLLLFDARGADARDADARGARRELIEALGLQGDGTGRIVPAEESFAIGPAQLRLELEEANGTLHRDELAFRVARFPGDRAPIGRGQWIWFDFTSDRDATPGPDFEADLVAFGLAAADAPPELLARIRQRVIDTALDRVRSVYASSNPARVEGVDAVEVSFSEHDPLAPETTRICVGGADPTGGTSIGHVELDPGNARRRDTLCGPRPPGGIYPRELFTYAGQPAFRAAFDPLRAEAGGTPIGAHPLDAELLGSGGGALDARGTQPGRDRGRAVDRAIGAFGAALGSVLAHEAGHALGLVPRGLGGGTQGEGYAHNPIDPRTRAAAGRTHTEAGAEPVKSLMDPGRRFEFADLVGRPGEKPLAIRALNHAYLRDRIVLSGAVDPPAP